jgi:hypothetical protein
LLETVSCDWIRFTLAKHGHALDFYSNERHQLWHLLQAAANLGGVGVEAPETNNRDGGGRDAQHDE